MNKEQKQSLTTEKYIEMISQDYQFDKKNAEYCGFLNVDPEDAGCWSDIAIQISNNQKDYEKICNKYGISIENGAWERELIFTNEIPDTTKNGDKLF